MIRIAIVMAIAVGAGCNAGHGGTAFECHGLELGACRLTDGCKPDLCPGCGCDVNYRGCLGRGEAPLSCPALGCPSGNCCSSEQACAGATTTCTPPGSPAGCGVCNNAPGNCATDATCSGTMICEPIACSCQGNRACVAGCVDDTTCGEGERCDVASSSCIAQSCVDEAACPLDFECTRHACVRKACNSDRTCDGFCINGSCFAGRGECRQPVP